ncbi:MAG: tetratricopeptide (TPR) repeat protein, partial [Pirellulaceae bacterium]
MTPRYFAPAQDPIYEGTQMGSVQDELGRAIELHQSGQLAEAAELYSSICESQPHLPDPLHLLGVLAHQNGQNEKAIELIERAITIRPDAAEYYINLGVTYIAVGRFRDAIKTLQRAIELAPTAYQPLVNVGNAHFHCGEYQSAIQYYLQALKIKPDHQSALLNLGISMRVLGNNAKSVEFSYHLLRLNPKSTEGLNNLGLSLNNMGHTEKAIESLSLAIQFDPESPLAATNLAGIYVQTGEFDKAELIARDVLNRHPVYCRAFSVLSKIGAKGIDQDDAHRLAQLVESPTVPDDNKAAANYCLGKYYDRVQQYETAWSHAIAANSQRVKRMTYRSHEEFVDRLIQFFSKSHFASAKHGNTSDRPVFVVGIPRSGTSLIEQILASHSNIYGAGELNEFEQIRQRLDSSQRSSTDGGSYPDCMSELTPETAGRLATQYLQRISSLDAASIRVVDKLPDNFLHLGLIATLFPDSRVIHCRRHPLDTCVSCYLEDFEYIDYSTDLESFADYYVHYDRLMKHWEQTLPIQMTSIDYESLVDNPASEIRRLVEFCGVEWDESCLSFYDQQRTIRTPSSFAVRQPVYRSSVGRWRNYQTQLTTVAE